MIEVEILADSINPAGVRLTTFFCTYPRFVHSEVMTHRALSRNASSSRAIPLAKMIERVRERPALPVAWYRNGRGMASVEPMDADASRWATGVWLEGARRAIETAEALADAGVHKSIANRVLEPWAHIHTIITATDWANFYALRTAPAAQPEFQALASEMLRQHKESEPDPVSSGGWHIPFGDCMEDMGIDPADTATRLKVATARIARLSYATHDGVFSVERDVALHDQLVRDGHWSPFEHCARAVPWKVRTRRSGNFRGWQQYRHEFANEHITSFEGFQ